MERTILKCLKSLAGQISEIILLEHQNNYVGMHDKQCYKSFDILTTSLSCYIVIWINPTKLFSDLIV